MFSNFIRGFFRGDPAPANPWKGLTLEWQTASPPPTENFETAPVVTDWPYAYAKRKTAGPPPRFFDRGAGDG
jgi:cytochrome c oxidase subunit 1